MRRKSFIAIACLFCLQSLLSQPVQRQMLRAQSFSFNHAIYVHGYVQGPSELLFKCYAYDAKLACTDSISFGLGRHSPCDFLSVACDTLHDVVNFYFQQANQKNVVTLLRTNHRLQKICSAANVDANRVNALTAFDDEKYVFKNAQYVIKAVSDSLGGRQFYLSKYTLRSFTQPFDEVFKWQFPFERQFIHRASVVYADSNLVFVYVNVSDSSKKGQWVLKINAETGELIRGIRLGIKGDPRQYLYSNAWYDPKTQHLVCMGNTYSPNEVNFKTGRSDFSASAKNHRFFVLMIDSMGNVTKRSEKAMPLPVLAGKLNEPVSYHCKVRELRKAGDKALDAWTDIYSMDIGKTLKYVGSWYVEVSESDMGYDLAPGKFYMGTSAVPDLVSRSKGDLYGKFLLEDAKQYDKFLYKKPLLPVVVQTFNDAAGNPVYLLVKTEINTGNKTFYEVYIGKKGIESKVLLRSDKGMDAALFLCGPGGFVSFLNKGESFELKVNPL